MRWKQFFTPVKSIPANKAKEYMAGKPQDEFTLLDVRQPKEYERYHIPGSKLIPIGELDKRLNEIDPQKPVMVYCAVGGRSPVFFLRRHRRRRSHTVRFSHPVGHARHTDGTGGVASWHEAV